MSKTYSKETIDNTSLLGGIAEVMSLGLIGGDYEYAIKVEDSKTGEEKTFKYSSEAERDEAYNNMQK